MTIAVRPNRLFYGDNLDVLRRKIADASVDLCYIDPPFNSKRNYFQIYTNQGGEDRAQAQAFVDTWEWGPEADAGLAWITDVDRLNEARPHEARLTVQTVALIRGLDAVLGHGSLFAYLVHMTQRIVEIHRVLKPTGSFYLHCDPTASHYLKLVCDGIFCGQGGDFQNEIVWCYKRYTAASNRFQRLHDVVLFYSKSSKMTFNEERIAYGEQSGKRDSHYKQDEEGRWYRWQKRKDAEPYKIYLSDGVRLGDWWEIAPINASAKERLGYPTQKPEALLERIIRASSNEGDVVLDAYCGCGTTVAVAQRLNRQWIGIDVTYQSIAVILDRFATTYKEGWPQVEANIILDGVPKDKESATALANKRDDKTRKEFEKWAILTFSKNKARINEKKGADGGIDGIAYFATDTQTNGKAIFQVKSGKTGRGDLATLNSDRLREKAEIGYLLCFYDTTKAMRDEITAAGRYKHPLFDREYDRLQVITIAELFAPFNVRMDLPMPRDAVKAASAAGDAGTQTRLL